MQTEITLTREELVNAAGCEDYVENEYNLVVDYDAHENRSRYDRHNPYEASYVEVNRVQVWCEFQGKYVDFDLTDDEAEWLDQKVYDEAFN